MELFTPWGNQQDPTPIRSWIGKNIPGAQALGDFIGNVPMSPYGVGPTWKDFSNANIQIKPPNQSNAAGNAVFTNGFSDPSAMSQPLFSPAQPYSAPTGSNTNTNKPQNPSGQTGSPGPSYNDYLNGLWGQVNSNADSLLAGLDPQKQAQEQIAMNNYNQGVSDINASQQSGLNDLGLQEQKNQTQKAKTLTDLADNLRNQMMAGNVYLGSRGAGDSSASNQYNYALTKMGNQSRGNVNSQYADIQANIDNNKAKLQQIATQELGRLNTEKNNSIQQIASWYADAQNQIKNTRGQNLLALGETALNQALSALQQVQQNYWNKQSLLQQWAVNNAKTWDQAVSNMNQVSSYQAPGIANPGVNGTIGGIPGNAGNKSVFGMGYDPNAKYDIFGNRIS